MKILIAVLISVVAQVSVAECLGEAQIIAKISQTSVKPLNCVASIDASSIIQYNENQVCPLDLAEVLEQGVEVGLLNGHDCGLQIGDVITGVLVKRASGSIVLE